MRWLARILGALALVLLAAALGLWLLLPAERIARLAAERAEAALGRPVAIDGGVSVRLLPRPGATLRDVSVGNAPGGEAPRLMTAEAVHIGVSLAPLLSGRIEVARLDVEAPVIALEIAQNGVPNWSFVRPRLAPAAAAPSASAQGPAPAASAPATPPSDQAPSPTAADAPSGVPAPRADAPRPSAPPPAPAPARLPDISLPRATFSNAVVTFHDRRTGRRERVEDLDLTLRAPALDGPVSVDATGAWQGAPLRLTARADSPQALVSLAPVDAALSARLGDLALDWTGVVRLTADRRALPQAEGRLTLAAPAPNAALARFGLTPPPEAGALEDLALQADIALAPAGLSLTATLEGVRNGAPLTAALDLTADADWPRTRSAMLDLSVAQTGLAQARWTGRAGLSPGGAPHLDGTLAAAAGRPALLLEKLGLAAPPLAQDLRDARLTARIDLSPRGLTLDADGAAARDGVDAPLSGALSLRGGPDWADSRRLDVTARGQAAGLLSAAFEGRVSAPPGDRPAASGALSAEAQDLRALLTLLGAPPPRDLRPRALRSAAIRADLSATGRDLSLRQGTYRLDAMEAEGALDLSLSGRPALEGRLAAGPLDLRPYLGARREDGGGGGSDGSPAPEDGWSKAPLDLSALKLFDARLAVTAPSVTLPDLALGQVDARVVLEDGALAVRLRKAEAFGGVLSGRIAADGAAARPALAVRLTGDALRLQPLLRAFAGAGSDRVEGLGAFEVDVAGTGRSLHALMSDLAGTASLRLTDGAILGVNLAAAARNIGAAFLDAAAGEARQTDFAAIEASFTGKDGRFRNEDFSFVGPLLRIAGAGIVDLGARRLDYDLAPRAVASLKGQGGRKDRRGLLLPLKVQGPWSALSIAPDLAAAAAAGLSLDDVVDGVVDGDPAKALEGAAEDALRGLIPGLAPPAQDAPAEAAPAPAATDETAAERKARRQAERKAQRQADRKTRQGQEAQGAAAD